MLLPNTATVKLLNVSKWKERKEVVSFAVGQSVPLAVAARHPSWLCPLPWCIAEMPKTAVPMKLEIIKKIVNANFVMFLLYTIDIKSKIKQKLIKV